VRILSNDIHTKGNLFNRLVTDVFLALGYEDPRLNVQKTGREVDVVARHRVEPKYAVGECKATKKPIGGADLNKFAGVLQGEKETRRDGEDVQGYFISLSGFTEAAVEQELGFEHPRFVRLDAQDVQDQLVAGAMAVPPDKVHEVVGGLMAEAKMNASLTRPPELLGHELGWIWLCVLAREHEETHFALVHADGQPLSTNMAQEVVLSDSRLGGTLGGDLEYLARKETCTPDEVEAAEIRHREYVLAELGDITLEGLPADEDAGARRIALGDLYVPLKVERIDGGAAADVSDGPAPGAEWARTEPSEGDGSVESIGWALTHTRRLAILGAPGSGKSTLVKHLAVAYAEDAHRQQIGDGLPDRDWLPVFVRCRDLGDEHRGMSFREILDDTPRRGEFPELAEGFRALISNALRSGRILLLVDGLDEISNPPDRLAFVRQMRTFLSVYPNVGLLLTSRETGFRTVAGALSSMCSWYRLAEFDDHDIADLTKAWHATVVGSSLKVFEEAEELARTIIATDRVRRLAKNPLLLTTLLLVKRWVGDLPRKRTVLYEKAIEVLLMTWNVASYEPIDRDEAIPQLAFVAHALTEAGEQSLSSLRLAELLNEARAQMPEVLAFARTSVAKFVERVEERSSLLIMTGHAEERGRLVPVYEFRHLTFQEYLAAVALVEGFYGGHRDGDRPADKLASHIHDPQWFEVVTLANVLAGRSAGEVVAAAAASLRDGSLRPGAARQSRRLLGRALADEVQMAPARVEQAAFAFGRIPGEPDPEFEDLATEILKGRYADVFRLTIEAGYRDDARLHYAEFAHIYAKCLEAELDLDAWEEGRLRKIGEALRGDGAAAAAAAAMEASVLGNWLWALEGEVFDYRDSVPEAIRAWLGPLIDLCEIGRPYVSYAAVSALSALSGLEEVMPTEERVRALRALLALWRNSWCHRAQTQAAWALTAIAPVERSQAPFGTVDAELCAFVAAQCQGADRGLSKSPERTGAALTVAYYLGAPWSDREISEQLKSLPTEGRQGRLLRRFPELAVD